MSKLSKQYKHLMFCSLYCHISSVGVINLAHLVEDLMYGEQWTSTMSLSQWLEPFNRHPSASGHRLTLNSASSYRLDYTASPVLLTYSKCSVAIRGSPLTFWPVLRMFTPILVFCAFQFSSWEPVPYGTDGRARSVMWLIIYLYSPRWAADST